MMKPNWDDAPFEATHWCESKLEWRDETEDTISDCCIRIPDCELAAHEKGQEPGRIAPEWDGEGLFPLVHTDCEMADERGKFLKVRIVSWIDGYTIGWSGEREQVYFSKDPEDFRPLRTKEQNQREELKAIVAWKDYDVEDTVDLILKRFELKERDND